MAFIDIFNFKKYFAAPSDSQVARYGHVNALYTDLKITTDSATLPTGETDATVNAKAGKVLITDDITRGTGNTFNIINSEVTTTSIILVSVGALGETAPKLAYYIKSISAGEFAVRIDELNVADAKDLEINFLVIN